MKKTNIIFAEVIKKAVNYIIDSELYEWPPQCTALYYQPARPEKKSEQRSGQKKAEG